MAASFTIADGNPHFWLSESVWCKNTMSKPGGWLVTDATAPGAFENPRYQLATNSVWVKVHQSENLGVGQVAGLYLYAGRAGAHYLSNEIRQPANQFSPAAGWTLAQWEAEMDQGKVVRIPWFNGIGTEPFCPISDPAQQPGDMASKWFQFKWEQDLIPPDSETSHWHVCLFAHIVDSEISGQTDFSVRGDAGFSQMNCLVDPVSKRSGVRRKVVLGNRTSESKTLGLHITTEGPAAAGSSVTLRFLGSSSTVNRLEFPDVLPAAPELPPDIAHHRATAENGHTSLRDVPPVWGLRRTGRLLELVRPRAGFQLPISSGETVQLEVHVKPGPRGDRMKVHLFEFDDRGLIPGGVSLDLDVK